MSIVPTNINNYLRQFAYQLEERILQQFPPLHQPGEPLPAELARLRRTPYPAQALAIAGIAKRWEAENSAGAIVTLSITWPNRPRYGLIHCGQIIVYDHGELIVFRLLNAMPWDAVNSRLLLRELSEFIPRPYHGA